MRVRRALVVAGVAATAAIGVTAGAAAAFAAQAAPVTQTATAHRTTVAFDFWRGSHWQRNAYGAISPSVLGSSAGEPVGNLRWTWHSNSATGHGYFSHMGWSSNVIVHLSDVRTSRNDIRYFDKMRVRFIHGDTTSYGYWNGRNWIW
jgi:hypothetical protein